MEPILEFLLHYASFQTGVDRSKLRLATLHMKLLLKYLYISPLFAEIECPNLNLTSELEFCQVFGSSVISEGLINTFLMRTQLD